MRNVVTLVVVGLVSVAFLGGCAKRCCGPEHRNKCEPRCETKCEEYQAVKREYGCK